MANGSVNRVRQGSAAIGVGGRSISGSTSEMAAAASDRLREINRARRRPNDDSGGFFQRLEDAVAPTLQRADEAIQSAFTPPDPNRTEIPIERAGLRAPRDDERRRGLLADVEDEPVVVPGDPTNLGERGRRRRTQDDSLASPVMRRGLLGV